MIQHYAYYMMLRTSFSIYKVQCMLMQVKICKKLVQDQCYIRRSLVWKSKFNQIFRCYYWRKSNMENHIHAISKTISRNIGMLTKHKHYVPEYILYSLFCTLILPYINYVILLWGNTYQIKIHIGKILKLWKWTLHHYRCHTGPLFIKHNI